MAALVLVLLALFVICLIGYMVRHGSTPIEVGPPPTDAELLQARLEIHRVQRGIDVTLASQEAQREAELTRQAIADALDDRS